MRSLMTFGAKWCAPCKQQRKILAQMYLENPKLPVKVIDIEEDVELTALYGISSVPTHIVLDDNGEVDSVVKGVLTDDQIREIILGP